MDFIFDNNLNIIIYLNNIKYWIICSLNDRLKEYLYDSSIENWSTS